MQTHIQEDSMIDIHPCECNHRRLSCPAVWRSAAASPHSALWCRTRRRAPVPSGPWVGCGAAWSRCSKPASLFTPACTHTHPTNALLCISTRLPSSLKDPFMWLRPDSPQQLSTKCTPQANVCKETNTPLHLWAKKQSNLKNAAG